MRQGDGFEGNCAFCGACDPETISKGVCSGFRLNQKRIVTSVSELERLCRADITWHGPRRGHETLASPV
ncbi:MAG: hypothetical protein NPIRA04_05230 [Nitrospirales bacterium]|nr:MAG: hypothetical protein NPIRA04_05230 [Nitrospirales bacterium]